MRIKITLSADKSGIIDFNYQHQIQAIIYEFLAKSNPDYSSWLHEQGYVYKNDKRFKLFVFSGITFHKQIKAIRSDNTKRSNSLNNLNGSSGVSGLNGLNRSTGFSFKASSIDPFTFSFQIASPIGKFIQCLIDGIFREGNKIILGRQDVTIYRVETLPDPIAFNSEIRNPIFEILLTPLESPIFVKKPMPREQRDIYLFPGDEEYAEFLNQNLLHKYESLYGLPYKGEPLKFNFRLEQLKPKLVKSFKIFQNGKITGEIKGTLQPFTVSGPEELVRIGLECGFGQNNSMGCGYVETFNRDEQDAFVDYARRAERI